MFIIADKAKVVFCYKVKSATGRWRYKKKQVEIHFPFVPGELNQFIEAENGIITSLGFTQRIETETEANEEGNMRKMLGTLEDEYDIYCHCCKGKDGLDITTGEPLKTFDEWLDS